MGHYNDFDLDIKKVQENNTTYASTVACSIAISDISIDHCTDWFSCNGGCTANTCAEADSCHASCGGLRTSCGGHCR